VFVVTEDFINDTECRNCSTDASEPFDSYGTRGFTGTILNNMWNMSKSGTLDRLSPAECLTAYNTPIQSNRRNLLFVANNEYPLSRVNATVLSSVGYYVSVNNTNVYYVYHFSSVKGVERPMTQSLEWIISISQNTQAYSKAVDNLSRSPDTWKVGPYCYPHERCSEVQWRVQYCLSEAAVPLCKLRFEPLIAIIVTCLNFCKLPFSSLS
jgi:hypothetical protein